MLVQIGDYVCIESSINPLEGEFGRVYGGISEEGCHVYLYSMIEFGMPSNLYLEITPFIEVERIRFVRRPELEELLTDDIEYFRAYAKQMLQSK